MTDDQQPTTNAPKRVPSNRTRHYYLYRLDRDGFTELAKQVRSHAISAAHAAKLAGFGDTRARARKGQRIVDEAEWQRLQRRVRIAEDGWPVNSPVRKQKRAAPSSAADKSGPARIDVRALIG